MQYFMQILVLLSVVVFCFGEIRSYNNNNQNNRYGNNLEWSGYTYNIDQGQCTGNKLVDEQVIKHADPYTVKKTTYTWMGRDMYYITCIKVRNLMARDENAGESRITSGGVGEGKVSIEMVSKNSRRLDFNIEIWGEATRQQADNMAIMTNTPNKILYMGGRKYCECR